jgi:hypothetical protein
MTYAEKLKDPRWQRKRLEILERDDFTCQLCNDKTSTLHIHHHEYSHNPWDIENEKLITYCEHCHYFIEYTKSMVFYNKIIKILKRKTSDGIFLNVLVIDEFNQEWININFLSPDGDIKLITLLDRKAVNELSDLLNNN